MRFLLRTHWLWEVLFWGLYLEKCSYSFMKIIDIPGMISSKFINQRIINYNNNKYYYFIRFTVFSNVGKYLEWNKFCRILYLVNLAILKITQTTFWLYLHQYWLNHISAQFFNNFAWCHQSTLLFWCRNACLNFFIRTMVNNY